MAHCLLLRIDVIPHDFLKEWMEEPAACFYFTAPIF